MSLISPQKLFFGLTLMDLKSEISCCIGIPRSYLNVGNTDNITEEITMTIPYLTPERIFNTFYKP